MHYEISTPYPGHTGLIAGVPFIAGRASVDDPPTEAIEYFRCHGFRIHATPNGTPGDKPAARSRPEG